MSWFLLSDLDGLKRQSEEGARMGFTGKQVIHPDQVPVVRQAFSPSPERVKWATGLIKAFYEHQKSGKVYIYLRYMGISIVSCLFDSSNCLDHL